MQATIILALVAGLPVFLALLLRVSALSLFLSVCCGTLLVNFLSDSVDFTTRVVSSGNLKPDYTNLALLLAPVLLTIWITRKTLPTTKVITHFLPIISSGLMLAVVALPLLPAATRGAIYASNTGRMIDQSQSVAVGIAVVLNLSLLWMNSHHAGQSKHGRH